MERPQNKFCSYYRPSKELLVKANFLASLPFMEMKRIGEEGNNDQ